MDKEHYFEVRKTLLSAITIILSLEKRYTDFLCAVVLDAVPRITSDFDKAAALLPFWRHYPPIQRGRAPTGTSIPWSEVGETAIGANILRSLVMTPRNITFPGLPSGADIRFATEDALIHFDVKVTGPNDREDEIVASPNQISGDGIQWQEGVVNSPVMVSGNRANMSFQPELPPFYVMEGHTLLCLTYFLKGIYAVEGFGDQPLRKLELICVPNGLLAFDGPRYVETPGLFIPGKDEKDHPKKRTRVRMEPLRQLAAWRRTTIWERPSHPR